MRSWFAETMALAGTARIVEDGICEWVHGKPDGLHDQGERIRGYGTESHNLFGLRAFRALWYRFEASIHQNE
jgi:hypothetical protein